MSSSSPDLQQYRFTGSLIYTYMKTILESGLLLDEDLDILLSIYKMDSCSPLETYKPSFQLTASLSTVLISLPLAKIFQSKLITLPPVLLTAAIIALELKSARNQKKQLGFMERLVTVLKKIHSLDINVKRYMKTRLEIGRKYEQNFPTLQYKGVGGFFETTAEVESFYFRTCIDMLKTIASLSDDLTDDFNRIGDFNPLDNETPIPTALEQGAEFATRVQDIHIWLSSKLLSYIGISFCSTTSHIFNEGALKVLLNEFPKILQHMETHYNARRKSFQSLRYSVTKWKEYKSQTSAKAEKKISAKLQNTLESIVDNLSIISEKSMNILETVEISGGNGPLEIHAALLDLRNHTHTAYESLDLLCRLHGVLSNSTDSGMPRESPLPTHEHNIQTKNIPRIHHDDMTEPLEENFELYLDAEDIPEEKSKKIPEDQSEAYLGLMLQELKQSLKQHERFIEAKKKRGCRDEEEEVGRPSKSPPRFDLKVLSQRICVEEKTEEPTKTADETENPPLNKAMPPPPPPPLFDLGKLEDESCISYNSRSMLDNIKALSEQLGGQEEVFSVSD